MKKTKPQKEKHRVRRRIEKGEKTERKSLMGSEWMADYPSSADWRDFLFTSTLGLQGFAHTHYFSHKH